MFKAISKMSEENQAACKLDEGEEVLQLELPAHADAPAVVEPCEEAFDLPPAGVAPHAASLVPGERPAIGAVGIEQEHPLLGHLLPEGVASYA